MAKILDNVATAPVEGNSVSFGSHARVEGSCQVQITGTAIVQLQAKSEHLAPWAVVAEFTTSDVITFDALPLLRGVVLSVDPGSTVDMWVT